MDVKLGDLIEKIKKEGIEEAQQTSDEMINEAKQKAASIISQAKKEAEKKQTLIGSGQNFQA